MANRICTHCKIENSETANYCRKCGFLLPGGSSDISSDITLIKKIKDLQSKVSIIETELKSKDNNLVNLASEKLLLKQNLSRLQTENDDLRSKLSSANCRVDAAEQEVKKAQSMLSELKSGKTTIHSFYAIFIVLVLIFGVVQCNNNEDKDAEIFALSNDKSQLMEEVSSLELRNSSLADANKSFSDILEKVGNKTPLFLGNISVRNQGEDYGNSIYSSNTTYINPKVEIFSMINGSVDIYVKFYTPYGLSTGISNLKVPSGYSFVDSFNLSKYSSNICEFSGWGNKNKGHWSSGNYRFEFYYKGKCIGSKSFTIY